MVTHIHVLHWYPNFFGGGAVSASVAELASRQQTLGARVTIVALECGTTPLYDNVRVGPTVEFVRWSPRWSVSVGERRLHSLPRDFVRKLRAINPDVVHIHGELNPDNLWVPRLFQCPIVLGPRGAFHPASMNHGHWLLKRLHLPIARRLLYNRISLFDALTPPEVQHIDAVVPDSHIVCIPHGGNPRLTELTDMAPPAGERAPDEIRLVSIARLLVRPKGLDTLLDAFALAKTALPERKWSLTLIGPDQDGGQAELEARAYKLGIERQVHFVGGMKFANVWRTLSESDLFVLLSRREGLGTAMVEALAAGKPVVVSNEVGSAFFPEIMAMPHVFRVPQDANKAAEAILEAVKHLPEFSAAARAHRETVNSLFSWNRSAEQLLACYAELLRSRQESAAPALATGIHDRIAGGAGF